MPTLIIDVDESTKLPCQFFFDEKNELIGSEKSFWKKSHRGLWILAAHTALERKNSKKTDQKINPIPTRYSSWIDALFDPVSRKNLPDDHWLIGVFGEQPRTKILVAFQEHGIKHVSFKSTTPILIRWFNSERECSVMELARLREKWAEETAFIIREISATILVLSSAGNSRIDSNSSEGHVTNDSSVAIEIESTFDTNFCVLWIDSSNQLLCLYPFPDESLDIENSPLLDSGHGKKLIIPEKEYLSITTPHGVETCMIFSKDKIFTRLQVDEIMDKIIMRLADETGVRAFRAPRIRDCNLLIKTGVTKKKKPSDDISTTRLGSPRRLCEWENSMVKELVCVANNLKFFHVPNSPGD